MTSCPLRGLCKKETTLYWLGCTVVSGGIHCICLHPLSLLGYNVALAFGKRGRLLWPPGRLVPAPDARHLPLCPLGPARHQGPAGGAELPKPGPSLRPGLLAPHEQCPLPSGGRPGPLRPLDPLRALPGHPDPRGPHGPLRLLLPFPTLLAVPGALQDSHSASGLGRAGLLPGAALRQRPGRLRLRSVARPAARGWGRAREGRGVPLQEEGGVSRTSGRGPLLDEIQRNQQPKTPGRKRSPGKQQRPVASCLSRCPLLVLLWSILALPRICHR